MSQLIPLNTNITLLSNATLYLTPKQTFTENPKNPFIVSTELDPQEAKDLALPVRVMTNIDSDSKRSKTELTDSYKRHISIDALSDDVCLEVGDRVRLCILGYGDERGRLEKINPIPGTDGVNLVICIGKD